MFVDVIIIQLIHHINRLIYRELCYRWQMRR